MYEYLLQVHVAWNHVVSNKLHYVRGYDIVYRY